PTRVPPEARPAVAEYVARANWRLRFCSLDMDHENGQIRLRMALPLSEDYLSQAMIDAVVGSSEIMDMHLPGLRKVSLGEATPKDAFRQVMAAQRRSDMAIRNRVFSRWVLWIDDHIETLPDTLVDILGGLGYGVWALADNDKALAFVKDPANSFDLVIQDLQRPPGECLRGDDTDEGEMSGLVFYLKYLRQYRPATPCVFVTANMEDPRLHQLLDSDTNCSVMSKPMTTEKITEIIDRASGPPTTGEQRVEQIADLLRLMNKRTHEVEGACFLILKARADHQTKPLGPDRFVQFCFECEWFSIEVPSTALAEGEGLRLLEATDRLYREADLPDAGISSPEDVAAFDPICRKYIYGDEQEAAEDACFVLYDFMKLDPGANLYVKAGSFKGGHDWEQGEPLGKIRQTQPDK
ncbi:MAG: YbjN domain-containing protein, partial [Planctomycetota bacterium]